MSSHPSYAPQDQQPHSSAATKAPVHEPVGPLELSFVRALYVLALLSTFTLWFAELSFGSASPLTPLFGTLILWFSYRRYVVGKPAVLGRIWGNVIAIGALGYVFYSFLLAQNPNVAAIGGLLNILLWVKLLQQKKNRDFVQILLLSVSQMVVAAVLTQALWYGASAAFYLLIATWTMLLFHFKREGDGDYHPLKERQVDWRHFRTHELISRAFVGLMLFTLLLTTLGTILVFISIPRVTTNWLQEILPVQQQSLTGLTDQIRLGGGGTIRPDYQVAMYAEFEEKPDFELLYRAVVQDAYDPMLRSWWTSLTSYQRIVYTEVADSPGDLPADAVYGNYTDNQMPRMVKMLPLPGELYDIGEKNDERGNPEKPYSIELDEPRTELMQYLHGADTVETEEFWRRQTIRYRAVTRRPRALDEVADEPLMRAINEETGEVVRHSHLFMMRSVPGPIEEWLENNDEPLQQWLREHVPKLVEPGEHGEPRHWTVEDARQVMRVLNEEPYYYTLERRAPPMGVDPTVHFLLERKGGHCEYFASALAMLLLAEGYRARLVAGYAGGSEWIESDARKPVNVVLNAHAHAWVEVQLASGEWVTFNPSPSVGAEPQALSGWELWIASLQYRWRRHVVDFDLAQQLGILEWVEEQVEAMRKWLASLGSDALGLIDVALPEELPEGARIVAGVLIIAVPLGLIWLAYVKFRKRQNRGGARPAVRRSGFRPMQELLATFERARLRRAPSSTPREFLEGNEWQAVLPASERELFLRCYHAARFGDYEPSEQELVRLREIVIAVRESLREKRRAGKQG